MCTSIANVVSISIHLNSFTLNNSLDIHNQHNRQSSISLLIDSLRLPTSIINMSAPDNIEKSADLNDQEDYNEDEDEDYEGGDSEDDMEESDDDDDDEIEGDEDIDDMEHEPDVDAMDAGLYGEGDEDNSGSVAARASFMAGANELTDIGALMKAVGPHCKCVKLLADGTSVELVLDMTPKLNEAARELGGKAGFVGQFPDLNVVVMCVRDADSLPLNAHSLPAPLDELTGRDAPRGDLLLLRMDDDAEPQDFTLEEWNQFIQLAQKGERETHKRSRDDDSSSSQSSVAKHIKH